MSLCRKRHRPNRLCFPFSAKLAHAGSCLDWWKKQLRLLQASANFLYQGLIPSQVQEGTFSCPGAIQCCKQEMTKATQTLRDIQATARQQQDQHLMDIAEWDPLNRNAVTQMVDKEKRKRTYSKLRCYIMQIVPTGLDKLEVNTYDDNSSIIGTTILTSPSSINKALIEQQYKQPIWRSTVDAMRQLRHRDALPPTLVITNHHYKQNSEWQPRQSKPFPWPSTSCSQLFRAPSTPTYVGWRNRYHHYNSTLHWWF